MLAQNDNCIKDASDTIYQLTQEEKIRLQCEAREEYYRIQRSVKRALEERDATIAALMAERDALTAEINRLKEEGPST